MIKCLLCTQPGHTWLKCPLFGTKEEFLNAVGPAPLSPEELGVAPSSRATLAGTRFEETFGPDGEQVLNELIHDDDLDAEQRLLAVELSIGLKSFKDLSEEDRRMLDDLTERAIHGKPKQPAPPPPPRRPAGVYTQEEMEGYTPDTIDPGDPYSSVNHD